MYGFLIAVFELYLFYIIGYLVKKNIYNLQSINIIVYYWLLFTILTMIWELSFVFNYSETIQYSKYLLQNKKHVWTSNYNFSYVLPWKLSKIFYAEYGAYADKKYMVKYGDWSRIIESTHAIFCGIFASFAIKYKITNDKKKFALMSSFGMGAQLMNSILYMSNYFNELLCNPNVNYPDKFNININCNTNYFPTGDYLIKRPFMYINIFWTIMPIFVVCNI